MRWYRFLVYADIVDVVSIVDIVDIAHSIDITDIMHSVNLLYVIIVGIADSFRYCKYY